MTYQNRTISAGNFQALLVDLARRVKDAGDGGSEGGPEMKKAKKRKKRLRCIICKLVITKAKVTTLNPWICLPCMTGDEN